MCPPIMEGVSWFGSREDDIFKGNRSVALSRGVQMVKHYPEGTKLLLVENLQKVKQPLC